MTREEALSKVKGYLTDLLPSEEYDEVEEITKALEPKVGHWIHLKHNKGKCSECHDVVLIAQMYGNANYCPNCGAIMIEPQESEGKG